MDPPVVVRGVAHSDHSAYGRRLLAGIRKGNVVALRPSVDDGAESEIAVDVFRDVFALTDDRGVHMRPLTPERLADMPENARGCAGQDNEDDDGGPGFPDHAAAEVVDVACRSLPKRLGGDRQLDAW